MVKIRGQWPVVSDQLKAAVEAIKKTFDLRDAFVFGGTAFIATGVWQIYRPAALIITGSIFFWLGIRKVK